MSKRDLKKYLASLDKQQVEEQLLELYDKFSEVKVFYDFVFNPKEEKLIQEAKVKISNEYFPTKSKRPKLRRSVAQKIIKHFLVLGVDAFAVADIMLYTIEVAMKYSAKREVRFASFFKSIQNSYDQVVHYTIANGIVTDYKKRILDIYYEAERQKWENVYEFEMIKDQLD